MPLNRTVAIQNLTFACGIGSRSRRDCNRRAGVVDRFCCCQLIEASFPENTSHAIVSITQLSGCDLLVPESNFDVSEPRITIKNASNSNSKDKKRTGR